VPVYNIDKTNLQGYLLLASLESVGLMGRAFSPYSPNIPNIKINNTCITTRTIGNFDRLQSTMLKSSDQVLKV